MNPVMKKVLKSCIALQCTGYFMPPLMSFGEESADVESRCIQLVIWEWIQSFDYKSTEAKKGCSESQL